MWTDHFTAIYLWKYLLPCFFNKFKMSCVRWRIWCTSQHIKDGPPGKNNWFVLMVASFSYWPTRVGSEVVCCHPFQKFGDAFLYSILFNTWTFQELDIVKYAATTVFCHQNWLDYISPILILVKQRNFMMNGMLSRYKIVIFLGCFDFSYINSQILCLHVPKAPTAGKKMKYNGIGTVNSIKNCVWTRSY